MAGMLMRGWGGSQSDLLGSAGEKMKRREKVKGRYLGSKEGKETQRSNHRRTMEKGIWKRTDAQQRVKTRGLVNKAPERGQRISSVNYRGSEVIWKLEKTTGKTQEGKGVKS